MKAPNAASIKKDLKSIGIKVLRCANYGGKMMLTFDESKIDQVYSYLVINNLMRFTSPYTPVQLPRVTKLGYKSAAEFSSIVQC